MPNPKHDIIRSAEEYTKFRADMGPEYQDSPREQPRGQGPGNAGHHLLRYESWTTDELRAAARNLQSREWETADRERLIEILEAARRS